MRALTFVLSHLKDGRGLGHALVCVKARYASVAWLGADRLDRRWVEPADWRMLELAIVHGIPNEPLEARHIIPRILLREEVGRPLSCRRVSELPVDVAPDVVAEQLDTWLRALATPTS